MREVEGSDPKVRDDTDDLRGPVWTNLCPRPTTLVFVTASEREKLTDDEWVRSFREEGPSAEIGGHVRWNGTLMGYYRDSTSIIIIPI